MHYTVKPRHKPDRNSHFIRRARQPAGQLPIGLQQEDELHSSSTSTPSRSSGSAYDLVGVPRTESDSWLTSARPDQAHCMVRRGVPRT
jgi:hypothetical protein